MSKVDDAERERRHKKNIKRREKRKRAKVRAKLPTVMGLSKKELSKVWGDPVTQQIYDAYADRLIAECQATHRKFEFPIEPKRGVCFPSRVIRHKGGGCVE
jgi:hypothetical protein